MRLAVYLPLLFPLLAAAAARPMAERLEPRLATWLLTVSATALAAAGSAALALLALAGAVRIPLVADLGHLSQRIIRRDDPAALSIALLAALLLTVAVAATARMLWRRVRALIGAVTEAACLPGPDQLVVRDDPAAEAFAIPGLPGRIVVSTGMLTALDPDEHQALLAHERAHLRCHHYLFVTFTQLAATANPLLRPLATAVAYTTERWADESAALACGDRHQVARAIGKAALATTRTRPPGRLTTMAMGLLGRFHTRRAPGPVPRRVAALLAPCPRNRPLPLAAAVAVLAATAVCSLEAAYDFHGLLELARTPRR
ncbi:M56 family metallopeptidase [Streptomyces gamaensis]|uniref:M56 family metallopeptidase n=1 Tax=Streptomyces gamaensis TaxID=1763542 RepID=A0ABW0YSF9_9ACTN